MNPLKQIVRSTQLKRFIDDNDKEFYVELKNIEDKYYSAPFLFGSNK